MNELVPVYNKPPYFRTHWSPKKLKTFYRFEASTKMVEEGFPVASILLGTSLPNALAKYQSEVHPLLEAWRNRFAISVNTGPAFKTMEWARHEYEKTLQFRHNAAATQSTNRAGIKRCCRHIIQTGPWAGQKFGVIPIPQITPALADQFYEEYLYTKTNADGSTVKEKRSRCARNDTRILRAMLNAIKRKHENLFYNNENPFNEMVTVHKAKSPRAANVAELATFVMTADAMGLRSISAMALYTWEFHARVSHFPYCATVEDYRGRFHEDEIFVRAEKVEEERHFVLLNDDGKPLYPALMERLEELKGERMTGPLFFREASAPKQLEPWTIYPLRQAVAAICKAAQMEHLTLSQFRKGGLTESGGAGLTTTEIMSISMHKTEQTVQGYIEKNAELAMTAQEKRLQFRNRKIKRRVDFAVFGGKKRK